MGAAVGERQIVLVKHALPELEAEVAPRHWRLAARGEAGARALAEALRRCGSFRLEHSREPKAKRTAEVVAEELGRMPLERDGFEEIDRPAQPILSREEHARHNARLFAEPSRAVVGGETAEQARARFEAALSRACAQQPASANLVVITHGTVIALFVAAHAPIDAFALWPTLAAVVLEGASADLLDVWAEERRAIFLDKTSPMACIYKDFVFHACDGDRAKLEATLDGMRRMVRDPDYRLERLMFTKGLETTSPAER